jgi:hypothetical protein
MIFSVRDKVNATIGGLLLILSGSFYLFFRNNFLGPPFWPSMVQSLTRNGIGRFVLYSLPDLLWVSAFLFFTELGTYNSIAKKYLFQWSVPFFGMIQEMGQHFGFVNGTFDIFDLLGYLVIPFIYQTLKTFAHEK